MDAQNLCLQPFQKDIMFKIHQKTLSDEYKCAGKWKHCSSNFFLCFHISFPNARDSCSQDCAVNVSNEATPEHFT